MTRNLSVFLDLSRLAAALLVLVGHAAYVFELHLPDILAHSGKEGVAVFFVLSGYVIAYVADTRQVTASEFVGARFLRMYSVLPLSLIVLMACFAIGGNQAPALYMPLAPAGDEINFATIGDAPALWSILRILTFTNEIWFDRVLVSTGAPYWSLAFEMAYYMAYAILLFARGRTRILLIALWALVCGPRILLAFPCWLVGVGAYHIVRRFGAEPSRRLCLVACGLFLLVGLLLVFLRLRFGASASPLFEWPAPTRLLGSLAYQYVFCLLTACLIGSFAIGFRAERLWWGPLVALVRYLAGRSFTLYVTHLPILVLIRAMAPGTADSALKAVLAVAATVCMAAILGEFGECRKERLRRICMRISTAVRNSISNREII